MILRSQNAFAEEGQAVDLAARSVRGGAISFAGQAVQFALQVGATLILARLLTPDDFGLVAMVAVIIAFGTLLRDAGLSSATVQARAITREQCSALFRVNALAGVGLGAVLAACGPLIAHFYGQPKLVWITIGLALPVMVEGFAIQHLALLRRKMMYSAIMLTQVGFQAGYFVGAVTAAAFGLGYWALVVGHGLGVLVVVILTFYFCRWVPSRPPRGTRIRDYVRFGSHVLGSDVVNYLSGNSDNILVGRFLGAGQLGLYSRAYNFFALPLSQIREPIQRVGLPTLRVLVDQPERFRRYHLHIVNVIASLSFPLGMACVLAGDFFVRVLLGEQWLGAVPVFRILGAVMLIRPLVNAVDLVLLATGHSRRYLHLNTVTAVVFVSSFVAGLHWGIVGVAASYAVANYLLFVPSLAYGLARSPVSLGAFIRTLLVPLGITVLSGGVGFAVQELAGNGIRGEGLGLVAFVLVYCGLSAGRRSVRDLVPRLWKHRGRNPAGGEDASASAPPPDSPRTATI